MAVHLKALIGAHNACLQPGEATLSYRRLATELGTTAQVISNHANGRALMNYASAARYARYFGVRVSEVDDRFSDDPELRTFATDGDEKRDAA